jgi:hypothetical protein
MATINDDIEALERVLDERPDDWETRFVLADRYDDRDERAMAVAQRWMAARHKYPRFQQSWDWWSFRVSGTWTESTRNSHYALPEAVFLRLTGLLCGSGWSADCAYREYPTRRAAEADLAVALSAG